MQSYTVSQNGNYQVEVTDANGCTNRSGPIAVENLAVGNSLINESGITIYPNPAGNKLYINSQAPVNCTITTPHGQILKITEQQTEIDISSLPNGMYILILSDENGIKAKTEKLVKIGSR